MAYKYHCTYGKKNDAAQNLGKTLHGTAAELHCKKLATGEEEQLGRGRIESCLIVCTLIYTS